MSEIVVLGSLNVDLVANVKKAPGAGETVMGNRFSTFAGGKGANQAYAIGCLGDSVAMIGRVGADAYGTEQIENLRSVGVSAERVRSVSEVSTGTALIIVEENGENRIVVTPGANSMLTATEVAKDVDVYDGARYALFQLETPLSAVKAGLQAARARGVTTILDPAPARVLSDESLELVDIITPNVSELAALSGDEVKPGSATLELGAACRKLLDRGVGRVVAKLGDRGALIYSRDEYIEIPARLVRAVDTTGAGDCFNGAMAFALNRGDSLKRAVSFAGAAAALSVMKQGAQASMPCLDEVERFMGEG